MWTVPLIDWFDHQVDTLTSIPDIRIMPEARPNSEAIWFRQQQGRQGRSASLSGPTDSGNVLAR